MGSLCSKSSTVSGGHTVLGSSALTQEERADEARGSRLAAAGAAERRRQAVRSRFKWSYGTRT
jgi:hypothetical protein